MEVYGQEGLLAEGLVLLSDGFSPCAVEVDAVNPGNKLGFLGGVTSGTVGEVLLLDDTVLGAGLDLKPWLIELYN